MKICTTKIPGCYEITPKVFKDKRGSFIKTFHWDIFKNHQLETNFIEEYYSFSHQNVLRGLHFQLPPQAHTKVVYCVQGEVMDAVVDLRVGSPTYGQFETFILNAKKANLLHIPPGLAHGFYVVSETATMMYKLSTGYAPEQDTGILWNSLGIPWLSREPIISKRDSALTPLSEFDSPFVYTICPTHD